VYAGPAYKNAAGFFDGYGPLLAVLPGWSSLSIAPLGSNVGAGSVSVPLSSPVFHLLDPSGNAYTADNTPVLAAETLWQVRQNGNPVFEFLAQSVDRTTVAPDETATVTVSGPGTAQVLNWGMAMPSGWSPTDGGFIGMTGAIQDPFDTPSPNAATPGAPQYALNTALWNLSTPGACQIVNGTSYTYNPSNTYNPGTGQDYGTGTGITQQTYYGSGGGSVNVTLSPGGSYLGGGPYIFAGSSFSASVAPPVLTAVQNWVNAGSVGPQPTAPGAPIDNDATNGSDVTQLIVRPPTGNGYAMIGLGYPQFFCEFQDGAGATSHFSIGPGLVGGVGGYASSFGQYWRISCDQQAGPSYLYRFWTSGDGSSWTLQWAHTTTGAANWAGTLANVYLGGVYNTTGVNGAFANFQSINGEITAGADLGPVYIGKPAMYMVYDQLQQFARRGTVPYVFYQGGNPVNPPNLTFTPGTDSAGEPWQDTFSVQVAVGTDGLSLLQNYAGAVDVSWFMQPGYVLSASLNPGRSLAEAVVFHEGEITSAGRTQTRDQIYNVAATADGSGMIWTEASPSSISQWGQRETWVASGGTIDSQSAANTAQAAVDQWANEVDARVIQIPPNADHKTVFTDIQIWDWIGIERSDFTTDTVQVIGISVSIDQDGTETHELVVNTYRQVLAQWFQYLMGKFGGQAASTLGALTPGSTAGNALTLATGSSLSLNPQQLGGSSSSLTSLSTATALAATPEVATSQTPGAAGIIPGGIIQGGSIPATAVKFTALDIGGTGINIYYQPVMPAGSTISANSIWYNTAPGMGNQMSIYTDGVWTPALFGQGAVTAGIVDATVINSAVLDSATINSATINTSTLTAATVSAATITGSAISGSSITGGTITGATFKGTDWVEVPQGEFFYSAPTFTGNLSISITPSTSVSPDPWNNTFKTGVAVYGGTAVAQLYTNAAGDPVFQMFTGVYSENSAAALYTAPLSVGSLTLEQMRSTLQGPASGDGNRVNINLLSSTRDSTTIVSYGALTYNAATALYWGGSGVVINAPGLTVNSGVAAGSMHVAANIGTTSSSGALVVDNNITSGGTVQGTQLIVNSGGVQAYINSAGLISGNSLQLSPGGMTAASFHVSAQSLADGGIVMPNWYASNSSTNKVGTMYYNSTSYAAYFDSGGLHVWGSLFGNGGVITVGDAITSTMAIGCSGVLSGGSITTGGTITAAGQIKSNTGGIVGQSFITNGSSFKADNAGNVTCGTLTVGGVTVIDASANFIATSLKIGGAVVINSSAALNCGGTFTGNCTGTWNGHPFNPAQGMTNPVWTSLGATWDQTSANRLNELYSALKASGVIV
jgi:hypothetical protein